MLERVRLGGFSGTYRIRSAELARDRKLRTINVSVLFLDDSTHTFHIEKRSKGSELLDLVFQHLELSERDYFGLQFKKSAADVIRWLDPNKSFRKQWYGVREGDAPPSLLFCVKFYVTDPSRLQEEYTRYQFYLQVKKDIFNGKLPISINTACLLASFTVQSELGDYSPSEHLPGYLNDMELLPEQTEEIERRISELHKLHRNQLPSDAEYNYLEHAKRLDMYGIDFHRATDSAGKDLNLGVSSIGLIVYQNSIRINTFSWSKMVKVSFKRKDFFIQLRREPSESYDTLLGFSMGSHKNAKALWKACVEHHSFFRLQRPQRSPRFLLPLTLGSKFHYSGRTELQAVQESKERAKISKVFVRPPSKRFNTATSSPVTPANGTSGGDVSNGKNTVSILPFCENKVTSKLTINPRKAWETEFEDDGGFTQIQPGHPTRYTDSPPAYNTEPETQNGEDAYVTIHLVADEHGRFGFNVKGGLQSPILVSRVAPHTPADKSDPRVCVGDQVIMINGQNVKGLSHDQVVNLIRDSREYNGGELVLTIKPNALIDFSEEEPEYRYVPICPDMGEGDGALFTQSLLLLNDGLASGSLLTQYEQMYRKNIDLAITEAKKAENSSKNRYRDISPYDCTRVVLSNCDSGDYINANYVNMEIPGGNINRYIATQGPLPNTVTDFWRMVQQESSHLIVMLTTVMERGRPKCHQYWPSAEEKVDMELAPGFSVRCLSEKADSTGSFVFRELVLTDTKTNEKRTIQHMQYLVWPDHGVPANTNLFLQFTEKVRSARKTTLLSEIETSMKNVKLRDADENGDISERRCITSDNDESPCDMPSSTSVHQYISAANPPTIVHCSAGIGRTGVLILMDTALALLEAKEPVYPLDIVQAMRDQRASMVQNVSQYRFVCECVCAAYKRMSLSSED